MTRIFGPTACAACVLRIDAEDVFVPWRVLTFMDISGTRVSEETQARTALLTFSAIWMARRHHARGRPVLDGWGKAKMPTPQAWCAESAFPN